MLCSCGSDNVQDIGNGQRRCQDCNRQFSADTAFSVDPQHFTQAAEALAAALAATGKVFWEMSSDSPVIVHEKRDGHSAEVINLLEVRASSFVYGLVDFNPPATRNELEKIRQQLKWHGEHFLPLQQVTTTPEFDFDMGTENPKRHMRPGYNPDFQKWYVGPAIKPARTGALDEFLDAVPFDGDDSRQNFVSLLLGLFMPARAAPYPIGIILADSQGVGKTQLAECLSLFATGNVTIKVPWNGVKHGGKQAPRAIVGPLREGRRVLLFDNLVGDVRSEFVAAAATSGEMSCPALYRNGQDIIRDHFLLLLTSNFATIDTDLTGRACVIRLSAHTSTAAWMQNDIRDWEEYRIPLVQDCLYKLYNTEFDLSAPVGTKIRFRRWYRISRAIQGDTNPTLLRARHRALDHQMNVLMSMTDSTEFTAADLFEAVYAKRTKLQEVLQDAFDVESFRLRLHVLALQEYVGPTYTFRLRALDHDKFQFEVNNGD